MADFFEEVEDFLGDLEELLAEVGGVVVNLLEEAGLRGGAVEIVAEGAEEGAVFVGGAGGFGDAEGAGFVVDAEAAVAGGGLFEGLAFALAPIGGEAVGGEDGDEDAGGFEAGGDFVVDEVGSAKALVTPDGERGVAVELVEAVGEVGFEFGDPAFGVISVSVADKDVVFEAAEAGHWVRLVTQYSTVVGLRGVVAFE